MGVYLVNLGGGNEVVVEPGQRIRESGNGAMRVLGRLDVEKEIHIHR